MFRTGWTACKATRSHGLAPGRLVGIARSHRAKRQARRTGPQASRQRSSCPASKARIGSPTICLSFARETPGAKAAEPKGRAHPDQHGSGQSGRGTHAVDPKGKQLKQGKLLCPWCETRQAKKKMASRVMPRATTNTQNDMAAEGAMPGGLRAP